MKAVRTWSALGEVSAELYYVRDKEKREVDFLIVATRKPALLVECKRSETAISPHLLYFQGRLDVPVAVQLLLEAGYDRETRHGKRVQRVVFALLAYVTVALGGFGNVPGTLAAGVVVGVTEALAGLLIPPAFKYSVVFVLYIAVVLWRPQGLFGRF